MKLNLTEITTALLAGLLLAVSVGQCSEKKAVKKELVKLEEDYCNSLVLAEKDMDRAVDKLKKLNKKNKELNSSIILLDRERIRISNAYNKQKEELKDIETDSLYVLLNWDRELDDEVYDVDRSIMMEAELTELNLKDCKNINSFLEDENDLLTKAVEDYRSRALDLYNDLDDCEIAKMKFERELSGKDLELKIKKKKLWRNRGIAGVAGVALILIAL